jgi:hypothetical protein
VTFIPGGEKRLKGSLKRSSVQGRKEGGMFKPNPAFAIASKQHKDRGDNHCTCSEPMSQCWWQVIYFPYMEKCADAYYAKVFGG